MNHIVNLTEALKGGYMPSLEEVRDMLYELERAVVDTPEFLWMTQTPESLADEIHLAIKNASEELTPEELAESADDWYDRRRDDQMMAQYEVK